MYETDEQVYFNNKTVVSQTAVTFLIGCVGWCELLTFKEGPERMYEEVGNCMLRKYHGFFRM
jgi:hypothetical protein